MYSMLSGGELQSLGEPCAQQGINEAARERHLAEGAVVDVDAVGRPQAVDGVQVIMPAAGGQSQTGVRLARRACC